MSSPTVIRVAFKDTDTGTCILQVVTYFDHSGFGAAVQEYSIDPATGRTVLESSDEYSSEQSAIAAWVDRAAV